MITQEEAREICKNRVNYRVTFILYNGKILNWTIPIRYDSQNDVLRVATSAKTKEEVQLRRDSIYRYVEEGNWIPPNYDNGRSWQFQGEFAKKLIIIGAGASFGYSQRRTGKMPLANEIFSDRFNEILDLFPGAKNSATAFTDLSSIEDYFQKTWDRLLKYEVFDEAKVFALINMQYYLSALFLKLSEEEKGNRYNYYTELVQLIHEYLSYRNNQEKVLVVSFNYDLLLEEALSAVDSAYSFRNIDDYVTYQTRKILLFKPHGSCNWFRRLKLEKPPPYLADYLHKLNVVGSKLLNGRFNLGHLIDLLDDKIEVINTDEFRDFYHFPNLLIPYKDKDELCFPEDHKTILTMLFHQIEDILVIGWKGTEETFKELLKNAIGGRKVNFFYANNGDASIEADYVKFLPSACITDVSKIFADFNQSLWHNNKADFRNLIRCFKTERNFFFENAPIAYDKA